MSGFTATTERGTKTHSRCLGRNHSDEGIIGTCDGCGMSVVKHARGKSDIAMVGSSRRFFCFSRHTCDAQFVAWADEAKAEEIGSGQIVKGQTVEVVRGRKVAKGTVGIVFWVGESQWGEKVGFRTAEGEKHFTAITNVEARPTEAQATEASRITAAREAARIARIEEEAAKAEQQEILNDVLIDVVAMHPEFQDSFKALVASGAFDLIHPGWSAAHREASA